MLRTKIIISLDSKLLGEVDALVREHRFADRGEVIEAAVAEYVKRARRERLAEACSLLDPAEERALAEEGIGGEWQEDQP